MLGTDLQSLTCQRLCGTRAKSLCWVSFGGATPDTNPQTMQLPDSTAQDEWKFHPTKQSPDATVQNFDFTVFPLSGLLFVACSMSEAWSNFGFSIPLCRSPRTKTWGCDSIDSARPSGVRLWGTLSDFVNFALSKPKPFTYFYNLLHTFLNALFTLWRFLTLQSRARVFSVVRCPFQTSETRPRCRRATEIFRCAPFCAVLEGGHGSCSAICTSRGVMGRNLGSLEIQRYMIYYNITLYCNIIILLQDKIIWQWQWSTVCQYDSMTWSRNDLEVCEQYVMMPSK